MGKKQSARGGTSSAGGCERAALLLFPLGSIYCSGSLGRLRFGHALLELVHAPGRIDKLLLPRVKRMADIANSHQDRVLRGTRLNDVPAGATNLRVLVFRMNISFHVKQRPDKIAAT